MAAMRICDIVPVDKFLFSDEDFLPDTITDQAHREEEKVPQVQDVSSSDDDMPLSQLICSNSKIGDESPVRLLMSNFNLSFNSFEHFASTQSPHRSVTSQPATSRLKCSSSPKKKFSIIRELFPYPKISQYSHLLPIRRHLNMGRANRKKPKEKRWRKVFEQRKNALRGKRYQFKSSRENILFRMR
ncbi:hypothetical protein HHI36_009332 [Cryptolaemus montrouzieri]|uniref:Uncharacterized protein n=1 Tax=Cryptolaemus montrouzieri TaxID=559131 RepID=A0ABD2MVF5_9CUCU